jgi:hypothetical protein
MNRPAFVLTAGLAMIVTLGRAGNADAAPGTCDATSKRCDGERAVITVSAMPQAPLTVSLLGDDGSHIDVVLDPAADDPLTRSVQLAASTKYLVVVTGKRFTVPSPDADVARGTLTLLQKPDPSTVDATAATVTTTVNLTYLVPIKAKLETAPIYARVDANPMHAWHECRPDNNTSAPRSAYCGVD